MGGWRIETVWDDQADEVSGVLRFLECPHGRGRHRRAEVAGHQERKRIYFSIAEKKISSRNVWRIFIKGRLSRV